MEQRILAYELDPDADALYIKLADKPYAYGEELDHERRVDYAEDRTPIAIELLTVSQGVNLRDLPFPAEVALVLELAKVRQFA